MMCWTGDYGYMYIIQSHLESRFDYIRNHRTGFWSTLSVTTILIFDLHAYKYNGSLLQSGLLITMLCRLYGHKEWRRASERAKEVGKDKIAFHSMDCVCIKRDGFVSRILLNHRWWQKTGSRHLIKERRWIKPNTIETNIFMWCYCINLFVASFVKLGTFFLSKVSTKHFEQWTLWEKERQNEEPEFEIAEVRVIGMWRGHC
jgi:hypothetical protein